MSVFPDCLEPIWPLRHLVFPRSQAVLVLARLRVPGTRAKSARPRMQTRYRLHLGYPIQDLAW